MCTSFISPLYFPRASDQRQNGKPAPTRIAKQDRFAPSTAAALPKGGTIKRKSICPSDHARFSVRSSPFQQTKRCFRLRSQSLSRANIRALCVGHNSFTFSLKLNCTHPIWTKVC